jgi:O-methyltransferase involved in polyketide biosynthesis
MESFVGREEESRLRTSATTNSINLGSVQKTLLLPLWGRAVETSKPRPLLIDPTAASIINAIDYDFSTIAANISFVTQLAWIARSLHIDRTIRGFLKRDPRATVVNLGCGLDTTFERVDNGALSWYDLDLPDVIELRSHYIEQGPRRKFIACSILDESWMGHLHNSSSVLFIAAGVLYYFETEEVKTVFCRLADRFPGCELCFDACSPKGLEIANKRVIRDAAMDESAKLKWAVSKAADLHQWDPRITVLARYPLFRGLKRGLTLKEKWGMFLSDSLRIMSMIHVRMNARRDARS